MSDTPEIEFLGNTANKAFAGHAFVKGHRRMIKNARIELSHFETKVDINASEPGSWKWTAVCGDGSAWLYFWRGEIVECVACPGIKPGHWILKATE